MDVLSDILRTMHLRGSIYFGSCFCAPWGLDIEQGEKASFHIIERGQCWLRMDHLDEPVPLVGGDILILPHGSRHQISDQPDRPCQPGTPIVERIIANENPFEGQHENFKIICGYFKFKQDAQQPFFNALPDIIHLNQNDRQQFSWLDTALKLVVAEATSNKPGKSILMDRVTEVLFIQVIRAYIQLHHDDENFLAALNDKHISKALAVMHNQPDQPWTIETLANESGMSRSMFANRFHHLVGTTPMKYLLSCRMQLAKSQIEHGQASLYEIAEQVGYSSDSSFKKAFKRFFDRTPASYRKK
ncbi:RCS-specific HTH-type transcriptional activator RclR [BD1-7 clade bacterium]|uniref:RCS-specific HTH-type transcriptional activator RclR n=1 Tax=BD1-7 clade bacterium TaxID=2029982 RepID=A0A5S9NPW6_9GAMM|nr:RCS-specific HTH-type transcriptional activator RclR [BD1-7 clade bacterium]